MPKVIDHDERRRDIIEVTRGLIIKGGIEAATMREIASEAGFANGALKHYFPGKDEIIQGTYETSLSLMTSKITTEVDDKRGLEGLRAFCWAAQPLDEESITAARVLLSFWERAVSNEALLEVYTSHLETWRSELARFIREGREDGDIVTTTPDDQLVDEIVMLNVGGNLMSLIAPRLSTIDLQKRHLQSFFERLTRP
ncbi:TetR/AcrR family transcriptional regulator [Luethyella okanaganae]|uniref:TetR/AcrR family transcriptional regulator n=1 Tax=Luethyella okanaganae TaxID=69372 RepID=A0ABW1VDS9_9MICO